MMTLRKCINGCNQPVHPPSKVLCKDCLDKLTVKLRKILAGLLDPPMPGSPTYPPGTLYGLVRRDNLRLT